MKYLVVKALLGFGDRLQSLKMCVKYALDHNLQIYVDWTDKTWSHDGETFYTYFKLVNMPVLDSLSDIPSNAVVYPSFWQNNINTPLSVDILSSHNREVDLGALQGTYPCDVLVVACNGFRTTYRDSAFFGNVFRVIHPGIIQKVKQRQLQYQLTKQWGIHLRGTDRALRVDKGKRLSSLAIKLFAHGLFNGASLIAVSDDADYIKMWTARYPSFPVLTKTSSTGSIGNHNISKELMVVSKHELNIDMLVDFFTLASCKKVFSTSNDSRFAMEAICLNPHVSQIIN